MRLRTPARLIGALALLAALLPAQAATAAEFDVEVGDFFFAPEELFINAGDTVTWTWTGVAPHDVTPVDPEDFEASETQTEGTFSVTFDEAGEVPYFCSIHASPDGSEGMIGTVRVLGEGEPLPEPLPEPRPAPEPGRLPAADGGVAVSLGWSALFDDDSAPDVIIGRDDVFADNLASGMAQGLLDAPLLLNPSDALDDRVMAELQRLGAERVIVLGGEAAISPAVVAELEGMGLDVTRVAGETRIETAIEVARTLRPDATSALLVRSDAAPGADPTQAFADSLAVGGVAAGSLEPVLMTQTGQLSASTRAYLEMSDITDVTVVGGTAAISDQVVADLEALGISVERVAGDNRFATAQELFFSNLQGGPSTVILLDGQAPDAWQSGFAAASAAESAPIVLSNGADVPQATLDVILVSLPNPSGIPVLCGPQTDATACDRAQDAAATSSLPANEPIYAQMQGDAEIPPGHPTARGDFLLFDTVADDLLCYEVGAYALGQRVTAAHIHRGAAGEVGPPVVTLHTLGDAGFARSCTFDVDPALVQEIRTNPSAFYVNFHTEAHPGGAVRGQLFQGEFIGIVELQPDSEVPPSDAMGGGFGLFLADADDDTRLCYFMGFGIMGEEVQAGHIHEGGPEENGPVAVALELPAMGEEGFESSECIDVDPALRNQLVEDPTGHYVNIHTDVHPDGALRGQIFNPFAGPPPGEGGEGEPAFAARRA